MAGVQSIERAFAVLRTVSRRPLGLTEIAERTRLPKSTVARLLGTLQDVGAVRRQDESRWTLGPFVAGLAGGASEEVSLAAVAEPHLAELVEFFGEDTGLALPDGHEVRYVLQLESGNEVQVRDWTGTRAPMHTTPSGLVLLAEWPVEALEAFAARGLVRLTPRTIGDKDALLARLALVRAAGHAWGREEYAAGITSVAAPVRDARGRTVAAIHVHGPTYRFPPDGTDDDVATRVVAAAQAIAA